jgi:hypothetical protein
MSAITAVPAHRCRIMSLPAAVGAQRLRTDQVGADGAMPSGVTSEAVDDGRTAGRRIPGLTLGTRGAVWAARRRAGHNSTRCPLMSPPSLPPAATEGGSRGRGAWSPPPDAPAGSDGCLRPQRRRRTCPDRPAHRAAPRPVRRQVAATARCARGPRGKGPATAPPAAPCLGGGDLWRSARGVASPAPESMLPRPTMRAHVSRIQQSAGLLCRPSASRSSSEPEDVSSATDVYAANTAPCGACQRTGNGRKTRCGAGN